MKIAIFLFAAVTLLHLSHCIPTHRYARDSGAETSDWKAKIREYMNKIPGYGGSSETQSPPPSQTPSNPPSNPPDSSYKPSETAGPEPAGSELHSLTATKDGNSQSNGFPSFGSYGNYMPNYQIPSSMNPNQYMSSIPGYPGASAGTASAASEPEASIAAKAENSPSNGFPSFGSYGNYIPNYQMPSSMNPNQYLSSIPGYPGASKPPGA